MNILKDLSKGALQVLRTLAPSIVDTAAGPFAPLIEPFVGKLLGADKPTSAALDTFLTKLTPEQALAVRQADDALQAKLAELKLKREDLPYQDTANARAMEIATKDRTPARMGWLVIIGFIVMTLALAAAFIIWPARVKAMPLAAWTLLTTLVSFFAADAKRVIGFFFGSSASSSGGERPLAGLRKP